MYAIFNPKIIRHLSGSQDGVHDLQEVFVDHILVRKNEGHVLADSAGFARFPDFHRGEAWVNLWEKDANR